MPQSAIPRPNRAPTAIFDIFRGSYGSELLTAAVAHFRIFERLATSHLTFEALRNELALQPRPMNVLVTALKAFGLIEEVDEQLRLTPLAAEHLVDDAYFSVAGYVGLAADSPGVKEMIERLTSNRPAGLEPDEAGAAFIFREGVDSAMEEEKLARHFTLALAGRAENVAPGLAERLDLSRAKRLVDVGGGTGIYSIALLQANPQLRAVVLDRPEVLKVAAEMAKEYGVQDRLDLQPADMFTDPLPRDVDAVLLSNILHDWDIPEGKRLVARCADSLVAGGRLFIHDVFLNDPLDGPLPIALYSAALFTLTEGRAYSAAEYHGWLREAGLRPGTTTPTLIHCGVLEGVSERS